MILINETIKRFGYNPYEFSRGSKKRIMVLCPKCKQQRDVNLCDYYKRVVVPLC
jgi:hypothetical protein